MDPVSGLNLALDSSLRMMFALNKRGAETFSVELGQLSWNLSQDSAQAVASRLSFGELPHTFQQDPPCPLLLTEFDGIHMRKDPPYDMNYIAATWLLDSAKSEPSSTAIYNDPAALRALNEKLAIFQFPKHVRAALVTSSVAEAEQFIVDACNGDAIIKPLDLFGGRGISRLNFGADEAACRTHLQQELAAGPKLIQPFDENVFAGEVRVFTAFGEDLAWCLKRPAAGSFLANTREGATIEAYQPPPGEKERVIEVAQQLQTQGVSVVGFDLIGGFISEINITSPRMLTVDDDLRPYHRFAELLTSH